MKRFLVLLLVAACGEVYSDPVVVPGGSIAPPPDAGGGFTTPRPKPIVCSASANQNSPCTELGARCEYGRSPDLACNRILLCTSTSSGARSWQDDPQTTSCNECPASAPIADAPCDLKAEAAESFCEITNAICVCTTGRDGAHAHPRKWVCIPTPVDCPATRPLLGSSCLGARSCDYGACQTKRGLRLVCKDDVWQIEQATCD